MGERTRVSGRHLSAMAHAPSLDIRFQQFLRDRTYVENVTAKTREWYETAWHAYQKAQPSAPPLPPGSLIDRPQLEHSCSTRESGA